MPTFNLFVFRQRDVRLAPRAVFLDAQRSFFSSKKEEETAKAAPEEEKAELSEAEKALHERIAELQEKHDDVRIRSLGSSSHVLI